MSIDQTHDPKLLSWVESANQHDEFPIQNLPFARCRKDGDEFVAVGIGDQLLNLAAVASLFSAELQPALSASTLNAAMNWNREQRSQFRQRLSQLLSRDCDELQSEASLRDQALLEQSEIEFLVPCEIGDYTDFYASVYHATNVGSMFRPDNPLLPNYKHIPIGYHGRSSSIVISGTDVQRPVGQLSPNEDGGRPNFGACKLLDYEMEVGFFVSQQNSLGSQISIRDAADHLFGFCLLNDWSARDIQKWEYQPLGPFLAKSFATTISPWVVTTEALAPFRCEALQREADDPQPLDYLLSNDDQTQGLVDLNLTVAIQSEQMAGQGIEPLRISQGSFRDMYWTPAQMVTHHSVNGCNLSAGDLLASGTVSGKSRDSRGCLLEMTWDGELGKPVPGTQRTPITLPTGEERKFLADGDRVVMGGFCQKDGFARIGFGQCSGKVTAALAVDGLN